MFICWMHSTNFSIPASGVVSKFICTFIYFTLNKYKYHVKNQTTVFTHLSKYNIYTIYGTDHNGYTSADNHQIGRQFHFRF